MVQWINLNWNNRSMVTHTTQISYIAKKSWPYPPTTSRYYSRVVDEIQVNFNILHRLHYLDFTSFNISAMLLLCQQCISVGFSQVKLILRHVLRHKNLDDIFSCHSLLSSISVLNISQTQHRIHKEYSLPVLAAPRQSISATITSCALKSDTTHPQIIF